MELFRVRLNCIDHYQACPTKFDPLLRNNIKASQVHKEPKVPVIRVFGATETGQKVCAHIHGAFPYVYIEYAGALVPDEGRLRLHFSPGTVTDLTQWGRTFTDSISRLIMLLRSATDGIRSTEMPSLLRASRWSREFHFMVSTLAIGIT
jgi:hypothetical protein